MTSETVMKDSRTDTNTMYWYCEVSGKHTRVRVFINGAKAGDLCFTNDEFEEIRRQANRTGNIKFHKNT